jgi:hypothetical protein
MLVEVDPIADPDRFMAEELPAVVGYDPGSATGHESAVSFAVHLTARTRPDG